MPCNDISPTLLYRLQPGQPGDIGVRASRSHLHSEGMPYAEPASMPDSSCVSTSTQAFNIDSGTLPTIAILAGAAALVGLALAHSR